MTRPQFTTDDIAGWGNLAARVDNNRDLMEGEV